MLECKNLSVGYEGRYMISKVDITFEPGKIYAIVGKNGAGKSVLLKTCAGQLKPKTGTVVLDGDNVNFATENRVAFMEKKSLSGTVTVEQWMLNGCQIGNFGQKKATPENLKRIHAALSAMRAVGLKSLPMNRLSCGERQRVLIAGLLAKNADYLFLDEPEAGLDEQFRNVLRRQLLQQKEDGKTVVFVTHDLGLATDISDEIIAVDLGREVHMGTPEKLEKDGVLQRVFK